MKKLVLLITALVLLAGCSHLGKLGEGVKGSGNRIKQTRQVGAFKAISHSGAFNVDVTCQKPQSLEIEGDDNLLELVEMEVTNGTLSIKTIKGYHADELITIRITVPDLTSVKISGAGAVNISGVKNDNLAIDLTGAAKLAASGETKSLEITNTGAGLIDAHGLRSEKANVGLSGAGQIEVFASEQLDVNISGVGRVKYGGNPKVVNKNISGLGSLSPVE